MQLENKRYSFSFHNFTDYQIIELRTQRKKIKNKISLLLNFNKRTR